MNVDERIERLIVRKLDGEITPDEQLELDRELLRSPDVRAMMDEYERIDALSSEVIHVCASARSADRPILVVPSRTASPVCGATRRRVGWMGWVSAAAACLALVVFWQTPADTARPTSTPVAVGNGHAWPAASDVGKPEPVGDGGVWRVSDRPGGRLDRVTDSDVLLIPDGRGNVYLMNLDHVREVRHKAAPVDQRFTRDPI